MPLDDVDVLDDDLSFFRVRVDDHVVFADPQRQFVADLGGAVSVAYGRILAQGHGAGRRLDGIHPGLHIRDDSLHFLMAGLQVSLVGVGGLRSHVHRHHKRGCGE